MKVNGMAYKVEVRNLQRLSQRPAGDPLEVDTPIKYPPDSYTIRLGESYENMKVQQLFVGLEDRITHIQLSDGTTTRHLTIMNAEVKVDWAQKPDVQSRTEWTLWVAEAIGHLKDMAPKGMTPEQRKFFTAEELTEQAAQAKGVAAPAPAADYVAIPLHPTPGTLRGLPDLPPLHAVPAPAAAVPGGVGPVPDAIAEYAARQEAAERARVVPLPVPQISSTQTPVDNEAGGPAGFDVDETVMVGPVEEPLEIHPIQVAPAQEGSTQRSFLVDKTAETVGLKGKHILCAGETLIVESVELTEYDDQEVVVLTIRQ